EYFDAYRIDHILGFFRIWEIPQEDIWALKGSFYPAMPYFPHDLQQKGLRWNEKRYTEPYIDKEYISTLFHENMEKVLQLFFEKDKYDRVVFKSEFDTQRKIENYFQQNKKAFGSDFEMVKKGLFELNCNVLFVRDNRNENMFHPRISVHSSNSFKALSQEQQQILDAIYVDYFYHRHNEFWKQKAYEKLPAIKGATQMLSCAEDLGMVPDSVAEVLQNLEILSLEIQRMPKKSNQRFGVPCEYPYLSVCTTSTHDMNPIRAWWKEDKATTEDFYYNVMGGNEQVPQNCSGEMVEKIVKQHLQSNSMFTILPLQDWLAMDENIRLQDEDKERINTPSNPNNFWSYRMHLTLNE
ncbi:MAG: 4-alpha-glucanotransferase, partial [Paludibacter sp.]